MIVTDTLCDSLVTVSVPLIVMVTGDVGGIDSTVLMVNVLFTDEEPGATDGLEKLTGQLDPVAFN